MLPSSLRQWGRTASTEPRARRRWGCDQSQACRNATQRFKRISGRV